MNTGNRVIAAVATVGVVVGGGIALHAVPAPQSTTAAESTDTSAQTVASLLAQSQALHDALLQARARVAAGEPANPASASATPHPTGGQRLGKASASSPAPHAVEPEPSESSEPAGDDGHDGSQPAPTASQTPRPSRSDDDRQPSRSPSPSASGSRSPSPSWSRTPRPTSTGSYTPRPSDD